MIKTTQMEIFEELPLGKCTHLSRRMKHICIKHGYSYKRYKKAVFELLSGPLGKIWARRRRIVRLFLRRDTENSSEQRTTAWLAKRSEMITASEVYKAFSGATPSARYELLQSKVFPKTTESFSSVACSWGTQFEPVAKKIYADIRDVSIAETGCIQHPVHSFLGASPDGALLTTSRIDPAFGRLVEFKCPIRRQFSQDSEVPEYYYHQMQLQMECTGIDECDYVEMQFKTCTKTQYNASQSKYKGVFAVYDDGKVADYMDEENDVFEWWVDWLKRNKGDEYRIVFWTLENLRVKTIPRDFHWMSTHLQELQEFWKIVEECRKDPSKMAQYAPRTVRRDGRSESLLVENGNPAPSNDSSSAHTMTLRLHE